jgi:hypothetical protein
LNFCIDKKVRGSPEKSKAFFCFTSAEGAVPLHFGEAQPRAEEKRGDPQQRRRARKAKKFNRGLRG